MSVLFALRWLFLALLVLVVGWLAWSAVRREPR
jgi:hypothetical protein